MFQRLGFADTGEDGRKRQRQLLGLARSYGLRLIGPNCLGIINTDPEVSMNASLSSHMPQRGRAGFFCQSGALDRNIEEVKVHLAERRDALISALATHLPSAEFVVPGGGYFLWADLGEGFDTVELAKKAKAAGAPFIAGPDFMLEGGGSSMRFSFASVPPELIDEGVSRIASVL